MVAAITTISALIMIALVGMSAQIFAYAQAKQGK
jgi:hypothetical protein